MNQSRVSVKKMVPLYENQYTNQSFMDRKGELDHWQYNKELKDLELEVS